MKRTRFYTMIAALLFIMVAPMFAFEHYIDTTYYVPNGVDEDGDALVIYRVEDFYCFPTYGNYCNERTNALADYMGILNVTATTYINLINDSTSWIIKDKSDYKDFFIKKIENSARVVIFKITEGTLYIFEYKDWNDSSFVQRTLSTYKLSENK